MRTGTLIVGGGLSGLALAQRLSAAGQDFHLIEARERWGGRILVEVAGGGVFDLGPAWFWPGQPRIAALVEAFGLTSFDQFTDGELLYEEAPDKVSRVSNHAPMEGSLRLEGGFAGLVAGLVDTVPEGRRHLKTRLAGLKDTGEGVVATTEAGETFEAERVVLAMPPRLANDSVMFDPPLPFEAVRGMRTIPTWMAGHAKVVVIYGRPFWRDAGFSGEAMSRVGPLVEIHDASPMSGATYALFGFVGAPARERGDQEALRASVLAQLTRLFGPQAAAPRAVLIKDWSTEELTATVEDQAPMTSHPAYGLPAGLQGLWQNRLLLCGAEVATSFGGYLEGALEAADHVFERVVV